MNLWLSACVPKTPYLSHHLIFDFFCVHASACVCLCACHRRHSNRDETTNWSECNNCFGFYFHIDNIYCSIEPNTRANYISVKFSLSDLLSCTSHINAVNRLLALIRYVHSQCNFHWQYKKAIKRMKATAAAATEQHDEDEATTKWFKCFKQSAMLWTRR